MNNFQRLLEEWDVRSVELELESPLSDGKNSTHIVSNEDSDASFFRTLESKGIYLNENQVDIVRHREGALVVNSVPGSGKSTTISARISYLIDQVGVDPSSILLLTYSRSAAQEMLEKAKTISTVPASSVERITSGTFHAVFLRMLAMRGENMDIWASERAQITTIKIILSRMKVRGLKPEDVLQQILLQKSAGISLDEFKITTPTQKILRDVWIEYEKYKDSIGKIDFSDILLKAQHLLKTDATFLKGLQNRFQYIMIDEVQDTNIIQFNLMTLIAQTHSNVVAVGDINQCIYSFSGANAQNIYRFINQFEGVKTIPLDVNYRSSEKVLGIANDLLIGSGVEAEEALSVKPSEVKPILINPFSQFEEAIVIGEQVRELVAEGGNLKEIAILYRNGTHSRALTEYFLKNEIPFLKFGDSETIYDHYVASAIIDRLKLKVGRVNSSTLASVLATMFVSKSVINSLPLKHVHSIGDLITTIQDSTLSQFQKIKIYESLDRLSQMDSSKLQAIIKVMGEEVVNYFAGDDDGGEPTLYRESIEAVVGETIASSIQHDSIESFLDHVDYIKKRNKIQKELMKKKDYNAVQMMTAHYSKGKEFEYVFILGVSEGGLPFLKNIDEDSSANLVALLQEERRLLYVAMTRSKKHLVVSSPKSINGSETEISRFLTKYYRQGD